MINFVSSSLAAGVSVSAVDQGNGGVLLTATGTFATCVTCDANGENCSSTNSGSVSIAGIGGTSGNGSATYTKILDRGGLHGTHTFNASASDCKGSASDSTTITLDNTPSISGISPSGTVSGSFDIAASVTFKPTLSATKGTIYAYINGGYVGHKTCTTETCNFSYEELYGHLFDYSHGGPYPLKFDAYGGGATTTETSSFSVNNAPIVKATSPSGTVFGSFDVAASVTFKPTVSATKGTIYAYINGGYVGHKTCTTETCNFSYEELYGHLFDYSHGGPYPLKFDAYGGGATTTETSSFSVDNAPIVQVTSPSGTVSGSFDVAASVTFKPTVSTTKGTIYAYVNGGYVGHKNCTTETCNFSYEELYGHLFDYYHGGPYPLKFDAYGGGATSTETSSFSVDNAPIVQVTSPSGTVSGSFDVAASVTFKPTVSTTKGTIYAYINGGYVGHKNCTTETCNFSYEELYGHLFDYYHGGPYPLKFDAYGGGATSTETSSFSVDNAPIVQVTSPSGTVSGSFDVAASVTFKPTVSTTKGTIYAYINGGYVGHKNCTTETCNFSYEELYGHLYTMAAGGPYTVKMVAYGGGASTSDQTSFYVDDVPIIPPFGCPEQSATSCPDCNNN
jgi:hypothetical protein